MKKLALLLIRVYQLTLSSCLGTRCRFEPSCSHYAADAIRAHGTYKGGILTLKRLCKCHPFGGSGYDPVPHSKHF